MSKKNEIITIILVVIIMIIFIAKAWNGFVQTQSDVKESLIETNKAIENAEKHLK